MLKSEVNGMTADQFVDFERKVNNALDQPATFLARAWEITVMDCADPAVAIRKDHILSSRTSRPRLDAVMIIRVAPELRARLDRVRQHLRMSRSEFARRAMSAAADILLESECVEISALQR